MYEALIAATRTVLDSSPVASGTNQEAADWLNGVADVLPGHAPVYLINRYLFLNDLYLPLKAAAEAGNVPAIQLVTVLTTVTEYIDFSDAEVAAKLNTIAGQLADANVLPAAHWSAIAAIGSTTVSRARQIGWPVDLTEHDVATIRTV